MKYSCEYVLYNNYRVEIMLEQTVQVINPCYISNLYIFQQYKNMGELYSSVYQVSHNPSYPSPTFTTTFPFSQVPTLPPHIFSFPTTSLLFLHSQLPPFLLSIPNYLLSFSPFSTASLPSPHSQLPLLHVASFGQACMK